MIFLVDRTSERINLPFHERQGKPCENAQPITITSKVIQAVYRVQERDIADAQLPEFWTVEISSLEEMLRFVKENRECIVWQSETIDNVEYTRLEIWDDWHA